MLLRGLAIFRVGNNVVLAGVSSLRDGITLVLLLPLTLKNNIRRHGTARVS